MNEIPIPTTNLFLKNPFAVLVEISFTGICPTPTKKSAASVLSQGVYTQNTHLIYFPAQLRKSVYYGIIITFPLQQKDDVSSGLILFHCISLFIPHGVN